MDFIELIVKKTRKTRKTIVLPEGEDERILKAAALCKNRQVATLTLLGDEKLIDEKTRALGVNPDGMRIVNPISSEHLEEYTGIYRELRAKRKKEVDIQSARELMKQPVYFGAMMVRQGEADGVVAGSVSYSSTVIRAGYQIIGLKEGTSYFSSFFVMVLPEPTYGENGIIIYADCAVNPDPEPSQLAEIAISSAESVRNLLGWEPRVAMLSFSTKGSSDHSLVRKVAEATEKARRKAPDILIDGELQSDAALVPDVASRKDAKGPVAGKANVLIFPNLDAGNIAYKLTQHIAGARAYGPILQGLAKPISDLSRGASAEDILGAIAITAVQAQDHD